MTVVTNLKHGARSVAFNLVYWAASIFYVILAGVAVIIPGRKTVGWIVYRYAKRMVWSMRFMAGIRLNVVDKHKVKGQVIIAAKHHSWFDGFSMYSQFPEGLAFVTGDHLEKFPLLGDTRIPGFTIPGVFHLIGKFPLLGWPFRKFGNLLAKSSFLRDTRLFCFTLPGVLRKLGAIVVNNCGGHKARAALAQNAEIAADAGRNILIYPEGHLSEAGAFHKYRTGVWHMYKNFNLPVVPVATNLGCFAPQQHFWKNSGIATIQFLDPIEPGMGKDEFMRLLEDRIEAQSNILIAQAFNSPVQESRPTQPKPATLKESLDNLSKMS